MPKRKPRIDWGSQIPRIAEMVKTMTDAQIGVVYAVKSNKINDIRKYYGMLRDGEKQYPSSHRYRKPPAPLLKWDFHHMNLSC